MITFNILYRRFTELTPEVLKILDEYTSGEISWTKAHNDLIIYGFNLKEDNTIVDY